MMQHNAEIQVRFSDLDAYGHVNNAMYLSYLEIARVEMIHDMFIADMARNIQYLLTEIQLRYIQPVTLKDRLIVQCWFSEVGKVRFTISYKLHDGNGKIYSTGYSVHALFDGNTKRPVRLPDSWKPFVEEI